MPDPPRPLTPDVVIFGGGAAGLWLLDELVVRGYDALLLEAADLGTGQTIASQGIIHGGLKYTLSGLLSSSARAIRDMPLIWRRCLAGEITPDLRKTRLRAEYCHVWRTNRLSSRLSMVGAKVGLQVAPVTLTAPERPDALANCPGDVARLDEQVIEPVSFLGVLADAHRPRLLRIDAAHGLELRCGTPGEIRLIRLLNPETGDPLDLAPRRVVFAAGGGNDDLHRMAGLPAGVMQRRPLHMVMVRGPRLPRINGHCVDGGATRLTITSAEDCSDRLVWQIGGQIAERGVDLEPAALVRHARAELAEVLPGIRLDDVEFSTYRVDRAEARTAAGRRPDVASVLATANTITAWPTKLALVPQMTADIRDRLEPPEPRRDPSAESDDVRAWPRPVVALPPWETTEQWMHAH